MENVHVGTEVLEFILVKKLESANVVRGYHWRRWHRETQQWQRLISISTVTAIGRQNIQTWSLIGHVDPYRDKRGHWKFKETRRPERRRVSVVRMVASRREFIKDDDNLKFALKPLLDALKRLGLIYDDKREWVEQPALPAQQVSRDGIARTLVRIERLA